MLDVEAGAAVASLARGRAVSSATASSQLRQCRAGNSVSPSEAYGSLDKINSEQRLARVGIVAANINTGHQA